MAVVSIRAHDAAERCLRRVTGIEPAWPAWKVFRAPKAAAELASILGIAVPVDAGGRTLRSRL
jgi:hypothetical protein